MCIYECIYWHIARVKGLIMHYKYVYLCILLILTIVDNSDLDFIDKMKNIMTICAA